VLNKTVPGHHQHDTLIAAEQIDISRDFQELSLRGFPLG
jgi:hypothetical protein